MGDKRFQIDRRGWVAHMMHGLLDYYEVVHWNCYQRQFDSDAPSEIGRVYYRPCCWDDEGPDTDLPNFGLRDDPVEVRWYKYFPRGLDANVKLARGAWIDWHDRIVAELRRMDGARLGWW